MLAQYFCRPHTLARLRSGPASAYLGEFTAWLSQRGYRPEPIRLHLRRVARFAEWASAEGFGLPCQAYEALGSFEERLTNHGRHAGRSVPDGRVLGAARLFVRHLEERAVVEPVNTAGTAEERPLLSEFRQWMRRQRGVTESTLDVYCYLLAELLNAVGEDPEKWEARLVRQFVLDRARRHGQSRAKSVATAVRMLLRFLISTERCRPGLDEAIPTIAEWHLSSLPRYLGAEEVDRVIAACDPATATGARDRAIVLLLARLGLRAGEVASLAMGDIDWEEATLVVAGKSRRQHRLPLTQEIGDTVLHYLECGRARIDTDRIFTTVRTPLGPITRPTISCIVRRAIERAGVEAPFCGAHVLRHSAATAMLRQGMSLHHIGTVLRHASINTTAHYAKVDLGLLREIAVEWPEVGSC